ncbi:carboxymuconolactone decarboxylase family protein [Leptospira gomenensis]|uniref:Carboxymuconolactone decarboxylase family protein n=1 Tax=Leptospira gomenensis TaxID=2484974 RepID=A0A5F1Z017_9LEPT|nr:carboxymuconolactone decarboxylase family protein [Leptospira gomenensis]TGK29423.1 carboxymuconolactone decarboxylase family protein [Leptospira gomenensis]TGK33674.1 carboxymuconolactone decarboxylase family protein [Leptospira gomenensis]TGK44915.1 carboxymuconolactone decarboxylase family protein [Leptospira gomenensis]TGK64536.1 carboxymuconolactone decarboxylase family protein [Leptospira gomenensis]
MKLRMNYAKVYPEAYQTMIAQEDFAKRGGIDPILYELIKIRVSQINGCAFCIRMHTKDLRALGEEEKRIYLLNAWKETEFYSDKEKAALELAETVTKISDKGVPDSVYQRVREYFDEKEFVALVVLINTINSWNRIAISTGMYAT